MMFFKRKTEVLVTKKSEVFHKVSRALDKEHIFYETRIVNNSIHRSRKGIYYGDLAIHPDDQAMYYIYVYEKDIEEAERVVYNCEKE